MTKKEIEKISDIPGVGPVTVEKLSSHGYDTILSIAVSSPADIVVATGLTEVKSRTLIQTCRENLNFGFTNALEDSTKKIFRINTGSKEFDKILGGGISAGYITECHGKYGSSKSQIAHQLCVNLYKINKKYKTIYIDTEGSFSPKRIREMSEAQELNPDKVLENIKKVATFNADHQSYMTEKAEEEIKKNPDIKLLIIDSIINHFRVDYQGMGQLAVRQHKIAKHVHKLHKIAMMYDVAIYVTNQVMDSPGLVYGNPIKVVGGNVLGHVFKARIYLSKTVNGIKAKLVDHHEMEDAEIIFQIKKEGVTD